MPTLNILLTMVFVHLLAVISPGPDFIVAVRNSLSYGRKVGIYTAIGFGMGIVIHLTYCYFGIALLISQSPVIFSTIKIFGALYLLYIAFQLFKSRNEKPLDTYSNKVTDKTMSTKQAIWSGFLTNALNPKATLFFLGLFITIVPVGVNKTTLLIACFLLVLDTILWFSLVACIFTQEKSRTIFYRYSYYINIFLSLALAALSVKILLFK